MSTINCIPSLRRSLILAIVLLITNLSFGFSSDGPGKPSPVVKTFNLPGLKNLDAYNTLARIKVKAIEARVYAADKKFNERFCFLVDMRLPSGKNRFFIYDLEKDEIVSAGLVSHGKGSENGSSTLIFSNTPNSLCTSLGKYKMGKSYQGMFGLSYKLYGLENSNNNAFERSVVLHSYTGIPKKEVYPASICTSEGCPVIAPDFLTQVKAYMDASDAPILLWIYY